MIVGRGADYILRESENLTSVFIHASLDFRAKRVAEFEHITEAKAKDMVLKADKRRASFYNFQTEKKWGQVSSYNLSIDSSDLGIDGAVDLIEDYIVKKERTCSPHSIAAKEVEEKVFRAIHDQIGRASCRERV